MALAPHALKEGTIRSMISVIASVGSAKVVVVLMPNFVLVQILDPGECPCPTLSNVLSFKSMV
jgi:hypothetical protein